MILMNCCNFSLFNISLFRNKAPKKAIFRLEVSLFKVEIKMSAEMIMSCCGFLSSKYFSVKNTVIANKNKAGLS